MDQALTIEELVQELDQPSLTGWKLFAQSSGLSVYRRPDDKLIRYKCFLSIADMSPEIYYKVAIDVEYRLVWDKYLKEAREISEGDRQGIYWQIIMPLFIDNRDYTFVRANSEHDIGDRHFYYAMTRCEPFKNEPPRKKIVRIETCQSQTLMCSDGANGVKSLFLYSEDPRGNIPKPLWTWAAKFGVPYYAKVTLNACKAYPEWIKDKKTKLPIVVGDDDLAAAEAAAIIAMNDPNETQTDGIDDEEKQ